MLLLSLDLTYDPVIEPTLFETLKSNAFSPSVLTMQNSRFVPVAYNLSSKIHQRYFILFSLVMHIIIYLSANYL